MKYYFLRILSIFDIDEYNYSMIIWFEFLSAYWTWSHPYLKSVPIVDIMCTFSIACCRGIPYSRRFRSVKAGACASAASLMIPLLPAIAGFSLPVPGVQLSSITIGRTMYCCLPSTCKNVRVVMNDAKQKPGGELLLCGARDVSIKFHVQRRNAT